jgi:selenobiotic family peptide radical SAM maturase
LKKNPYRLAPSLRMESREGKIFLHYRPPSSRKYISEPATPDELLGLKIVSEKLSLEKISREQQIDLPKFFRLLSRMDRKGLLQAPPELLRRDRRRFSGTLPDELFTVVVFGLQWHLTNACDLNCRHCYDRSSRPALKFRQLVKVLDQLEFFSRKHWTGSNITFTGGNPFLSPDFLPIYQEAVNRNIMVSVMGNPVSEESLGRLCAIQKPLFFQISLEGRARVNDSIRGRGSFQRAIEFLRILKKKEIPSSVMMTVHEGNISEVLPLGRALSSEVDSFTFNRLHPVGNGAALRPPSAETFRQLLREYVQDEPRQPHWAFKENLINLCLAESGREPFHGCTGYGCGAGFNFLIVLPDGEVHACRKFPSMLGNITEKSMEEIYFSSAARRYRRGIEACDHCEHLAVCGGCQATIGSSPKKPVQSTDPFCWKIKE